MISINKYSLKIAWLYPDLMSTYGDRGNIIALTRRCQWRGIGATVKQILLDTPVQELQSCDLLFMGGAQDRQQRIAADNLRKNVKLISDMAERGIPGLYICGAFQFLGKFYKEANGNVIEGLGILDLHTINPGSNTKRLIGDVITWSQNIKSYLVGFENHGGRTYLGKGVCPIGKVLKGFGNNGEDGTEGAVYKNTFGTYLHGPVLPKNPHLADHLITRALEIKYKEKIQLTPPDDTLEKQAHMFIAKRLGVEI